MRTTLAVAAFATCVTLAACTGGDGVSATSPVQSLASCAPGTAILTVPPIALGDIGGWVPLGAINPPGHTFPTDHQYLYLSSFTTPSAQRPIDLVAPGNVTVTRARRTTYSTDNHTDYSLSFSPCRETAGEFGHVATIAPALLARLGPFDQRCDSYSPNPGLTVTACYTRLIAVEISAGEALGAIGGGAPNPASLDFSFWDHVDPTQQIDVSMGASLPGFPAGQYRFAPVSSGAVNRHPSQITPDGQTYCYELQYGGVLLLRLIDATTLRVEGRPSATTCALAAAVGVQRRGVVRLRALITRSVAGGTARG